MAVSSTPPGKERACYDACGARVDEEQAPGTGWSWLSIAGAWRCPACHRALVAVRGIRGPVGDRVLDPSIPDYSRGALPKETASTITPPALKG